MASIEIKNIVNPLLERNLEGFCGTKGVLFFFSFGCGTAQGTVVRLEISGIAPPGSHS